MQDDRFGGIQRLYGLKAFQKIQKMHIAVIGLGGVGSWTVEALARTGIEAITLVDFDDICVSNTNRQLHAIKENIGRYKTSVLKDRILSINPNLKVREINEAYSQETESDFFSESMDGVVDAIDHGPTKLQLVLSCRERNLPLVISGSAGGRMDFSKIKVGDLSESCEDPMLSSLRKKLRQQHHFPRKGTMGIPCVYSTEKPTYFLESGITSLEKPKNNKRPLDCSTGMGTVTPVTGSFGFALSDLIVKKLM